MRVVIQRVKSSQVIVASQVIASIGRGLNILVGIAANDTEAEIEWMTRKCLDLRLFPGEDNGEDKWEKSITQIQGELLVVSQFTLYGDCQKGRRPSFTNSAKGEIAQQLYEKFVYLLGKSGLKVQTGQFGANMQVIIENDGPVTLILSKEP